MNYYIKVGKMYIKYIVTSVNNIKTEFISDIYLSSRKDSCMTICEEEKEFYIDKIIKILELYDMINDNIHFEEVEEEEEDE